ncbi:type II toxin-antitoxin system VapB family antitoxin [Rhizobium sp. X9]|uniref:type II toxin-antitoxin system VapB family antitoxin n=1 Tax=Rhizobium sp. X9 TaxID=2815360 RepID=UPI001C0CAA8F|nr:type II toxin-antitoxin system VapB family antitoxin [Rhizobium sp. X9]
MAKKTSKSESLSIRMDPKTRFMLEFVARLRGQTITTVIERAITESANRATIQPDYNEPETSWRDFWSVNEGERSLKIAGEPQLHPTFEEERRLAFTKRFWPFFYKDKKCSAFREDYIDILWPSIDNIIENHDELKHSNINAGPEYMSSLLSDAKIDPPRWPPLERSGFADAMDDDDIPF